MLKKATCIPYGQINSLVRRSLARPVRQYAVSIHWSPYPIFYRTAIGHSCRSLSTAQPDTPNKAREPTPLPKSNQDELKSQSQGAREELAGAESKGDGESQFVVTPRFQWRWRWGLPGSGRSRKKAENKNGVSKRELAQDKPGSDHFLPTRSEQEQNQLRSVMESLTKMSEELQPPLSPLEKEFEDNEWKPKRQPTKQERQKLSFNPWAMMLAGRLRFDAGSRVRLPEPLLLPLGQVRSPGNDSVYLLPDDLANLEAYDAKLRKGLRRVAMMDLPRENGGTTVNVSPYKLLIDELTEEFVVWDYKLKSGRTKNGMLAKRLLPTRWIERIQRVRAYQTASKDYWDLKEKLGETDEQDFKRPEPPFDVMKLQWQPNIAERMQSIMRQRLLLSIDHLGRKVNEPRSRSRRHVMCFEWSESFDLDVIAESTRIPTDTREPGAASTNYSLSAQHYKPEEQAASPGSSAVLPSWTPSPSTYHFLDPDVWLPGSCFLHIGPAEMALTALSPSQQGQTPLTGQESLRYPTNKFIPPMLKVNNNLRLPVFNIPTLLGPRFDHPLHQILAQHEMGPPHSNDKNYLILIRATAPGYHYVVSELWQLWRYLGGTDSLRPAVKKTSEDDQQNPTQKEKDRIKEYFMSKRVWDHLYTFLPGTERMPPNQQVKPQDEEVKS